MTWWWIFFVEFCPYHDCWCPGYARSQVISSHGIDIVSGIILCMGPANGRWRYNVTSYLIGWAHTQTDSCSLHGIFQGMCHYWVGRLDISLDQYFQCKRSQDGRVNPQLHHPGPLYSIKCNHASHFTSSVCGATRLGIKMITLLWNLTGIVLLRLLWNVTAIGQL